MRQINAPQRFAIWLVFILSLVFWGSCKTARGQTNHDVAHWLDRDTTLLINIDDVPTTIQQIHRLELFANPRFRKAIEMFADERFPLLKTEDSDKVLEKLFELESLVKDIKQLSFAIHRFDDLEFTWSLFLRAESPIAESIETEFFTVDGILKKSDLFAPDSETNLPEAESHATPEPNLEPNSSQPGNDAENSEINPTTSEPPKDLGWCKLSKVGDWLICSNHPAFIENLPSRIADRNFRSLAQARKYQAISQRKSPLKKHAGRISVYGNPVGMKKFFPNIKQEDWDQFQIHELPACGLNIVITDPEKTDDVTEQTQPILLADATITFTEPAVGYAKGFEQYKPFEIPPLAVKPIELTAFSRDEKQFVDEAVRVHDQKFGPGAAEQAWKKHFEKTALDIYEDAIPRRAALFSMRFLSDDHSADRPGFLSLEQINDYEAALRYVTEVTDYAIRDFGKELLRQEIDGNLWWTLPQESYKENSGRTAFERSAETRVDLINPQHDAYVLTPRWWVQGDMPAVADQVDLLAGGEHEDFGEPIRRLIEDLGQRLGATGPAVMANYFTRESWQENLNQIEWQYALANSTPRNFRIKLNDGSGFILLTDEDGSDDDQRENQSHSGGVIQLSFAPVETSDGSKSGGEMLKLQQSIQIMLPMPLGQRNEDGYRFDLKRRQDLRKAIEIMFLTSLAETFPRQLFVYTSDQGYIRVLMGAYPDEQPDSNQ